MTKKKSLPNNQWPNRIVDHGEEDPEQLLANPFNYRIHPKEQQDAMLGTIAEVGLIQSVIVNKRTGHLVDGHLRVILAMRAAQKKIPVVYVDLSEAEERKALASYDVLTGMVSIDKTMFAEMMAARWRLKWFSSFAATVSLTRTRLASCTSVPSRART